ncbi:hypothetical protein GCM10010193_63900 [Kitasatospora atroaurantiaca]|uniref:Uncharacterized protein n=1 Tax=Kitasatospora atroaurantiaca TaxID=285545 RepID=A0A561F1P3_9ACTN|nr:DUF485 domain-containing protein [Kitasatospora atroaurantiaca]TWE21785.1 hypothetical protein FB465_7005 [Kitasatospora atroaurantiaca]
MSSPFQPYAQRPAAPAPPSGPPSTTLRRELAALHLTRLQLARGFAVANGLFFTAALLLACTAGGLLGTEVIGRINLGMALGLIEGVLLLGSAALFDRRSDRVGDRTADDLRTRSAGPDERHAATADGHDPRYGSQYAAWDNYLYAGQPPATDHRAAQR